MLIFVKGYVIVSLWDKITSVKFTKWYNLCMFDDAVTDSSVSAELIQKIGTFNCASFPQCHGWYAYKRRKKLFVYTFKFILQYKTKGWFSLRAHAENYDFKFKTRLLSISSVLVLLQLFARIIL